MPGTAYVLFHHVMGETDGKRGVWGYVRGGMGGLTQALARRRAEPRRRRSAASAEVARILVRDGRVAGVALAAGEEFHAPVVASNADARVTFLRLVERTRPAGATSCRRSSGSTTTARRSRSTWRSPSCRTSARSPASTPGPQHRGTIHICPDQDYIERAYDDAKYGRPSAAPVLECTIPSVVDPTVAPPGQHLMSMFVQYAPYQLRGTTWDERARAVRGSLLRRCSTRTRRTSSAR